MAEFALRVPYRRSPKIKRAPRHISREPVSRTLGFVIVRAYRSSCRPARIPRRLAHPALARRSPSSDRPAKIPRHLARPFSVRPNPSSDRLAKVQMRPGPLFPGPWGPRIRRPPTLPRERRLQLQSFSSHRPPCPASAARCAANDPGDNRCRGPKVPTRPPLRVHANGRRRQFARRGTGTGGLGATVSAEDARRPARLVATEAEG